MTSRSLRGVEGCSSAFVGLCLHTRVRRGESGTGEVEMRDFYNDVVERLT